MKFYKLASHFSPILCDRGTWNFFCILTPIDTLYKKNFIFLNCTVFGKNAMISCENSKLHSCRKKQVKFYKLALHFSPILCYRGIWNFFLYINPYEYSMQIKIHVPRSHSFWEKCDDNLQLASHFSEILCDWGTWNLFCKLTPVDPLYKKNFIFLDCTVF